MSEEEKKAIEYLKNNCLARIEYDDFGNEKIIAYGNSYKYILLKLIKKQDKIIDLIAEDYSKYQLRRSYMGEITETAYGIKSRLRKEVEND